MNDRDFSGTEIKKPAEKMRTMAIINAKDDAIGLNKINFSLTILLQKNSFKDICYIMGQWATEPVRRSPGKFIRFPAAGKDALKTRVDAMLDHLKQRPDLTDSNIETLKIYMHNAIDHEIMYIGSNDSNSSTVQSA